MKKFTITADDIREALHQRYCQPEYELVEEVKGHGERRADAIAVNMWPSRGNAITGFEIKVSKQDLKRELQTGAKADALARYCHYWVLVVAKGITENLGMVIPENWGIMEFDGTSLRMTHEPKYNDNASIDNYFTANLLRAQFRDRDKYVHAENRKFMSEEIKRREQIIEDRMKQYVHSFGNHDPKSDYARFQKALKKANVYMPADIDSYAEILKIADKLQCHFSEHHIFKGYFGNLIDFANRLEQSAREQQKAFNRLLELEDSGTKVGDDDARN